MIQTVIGIIGSGLISWFLTKLYYSKNISKPRFKIRSDYISSNVFETSGITIRQNNKILNSITITRVAIWNNGSTIKKTDVAEKNPISIIFTGNEQIVNTQILFANKANGFNLKTINGNIVVGFDYIARNQGIVVKIFHTGEGAKNIKLTGSFVDGRELVDNGETSSHRMIRQFDEKKLKFQKAVRLIMAWSIGVFLLLLLLCLYFFVFKFDNVNNVFTFPFDKNYNKGIDRVLAIIILIIFIIVYLIQFIIIIRNTKHRMPFEIEKAFYESINSDEDKK